MMQGWIISWNAASGGGWVNKVSYQEAVRAVQSLIKQGVSPDQIVVNHCGIDHHSAESFLRQYGARKTIHTKGRNHDAGNEGTGQSCLGGGTK